MSLYTLGLNHTTAPIEVRERVAFSPDAISDALRDLVGARRVKEAAILSTCSPAVSVGSFGCGGAAGGVAFCAKATGAAMSVAAASDWIIDIGPGAGDEGGRIVAAGSPDKVATSPKSRTAAYLARAQ